MKKFIYSAVEGEDVRIEIEGELTDVLICVGELIRNIYSTYSRHEPTLADMFKFGIQQLANNPMAPTWKIKNLPDGGIEIVTARPKGGTSDGK